MDGLSEEERKALRGSKFAPLPPPPPSRSKQPRLAHPGGPLTTNKAAALAKFLERKLQDPNGLASINPDLIERAVKNAKDTFTASSGALNSGRSIRHVTSFDDDDDDDEDSSEEVKVENSVLKKRRKNIKKEKKKKNKKEKKKNKKQKMEDIESTKLKRPKKKLKL